jgi:hypothetical protein
MQLFHNQCIYKIYSCNVTYLLVAVKGTIYELVCQLNNLVASLGLINLLRISFTPENSPIKKK